MLTEVDVGADFEVILGVATSDPLGREAITRDKLEELRAAGATMVSCGIAARSVEHYCEQLTALKDIADTI